MMLESTRETGARRLGGRAVAALSVVAIVLLIGIGIALKARHDHDVRLAAAHDRYSSINSLATRIGTLSKSIDASESLFEAADSDGDDAGDKRHVSHDQDAMYTLAKQEQTDVSNMASDESDYEGRLRDLFDAIDARYPNASASARNTLTTLQDQRADAIRKWGEAINTITDGLHAEVNGDTPQYSNEDVSSDYDATQASYDHAEATRATLEHEMTVMLARARSDWDAARADLIAAGGKPN